jgi:hypothetical protein
MTQLASRVGCSMPQLTQPFEFSDRFFQRGIGRNFEPDDTFRLLLDLTRPGHAYILKEPESEELPAIVVHGTQ